MVQREIRSYGWRATLDLSAQVLALDVPKELYVRFDEGNTTLAPTLPHDPAEPVSASTLLLKARQFDDGLLAAVDLAAQRGLGPFVGKADFLRSLVGVLPDTPEQLKPTGFYTWTPELSAIFRQDRWLQRPLADRTADILDAVFARDPSLVAARDAIRRLNARLTNPPTATRALFPASRSHEQTLIERLYGDRPIPAGFSLIDEVIAHARAGTIDLSPRPDSGWYDWQTWALEPLLCPDDTPDAPRLHLGDRYRRHLEDVFRGGLTLARDTQIKQLGYAKAGCKPRPTIWIRPDLSVEPMPEVYYRRAAGYTFVREVLDESFGQSWLTLRRLTPDGPVDTPLGDELLFMERLFDGAASVSRREIGTVAPDTGRDTFAAWRSALADGDPQDARCMVPVFHDVGRDRLKVWLFLGWDTVDVDITYHQTPSVLAVEAETPEAEDRYEQPEVKFLGESVRFAVPVTAEVYVSRLLDRDEFRRHCDQHRTRSAILRRLE